MLRWFVVRYMFYMLGPAVALLISALWGTHFPAKDIGGVSSGWFCLWLLFMWLALWTARIIATGLTALTEFVSTVLAWRPRKWSDMARQLELPITFFIWYLAIKVSFARTMVTHHSDGNNVPQSWEVLMDKCWTALFGAATVNLIQKAVLQVYAILFHRQTYADRIELNDLHILFLTRIYEYSKKHVDMDDGTFGDKLETDPFHRVLDKTMTALCKAGILTNRIVGDFNFRHFPSFKTHFPSVVLKYLDTSSGCDLLTRRIFYTFSPSRKPLRLSDIEKAFEDCDEARAAFDMLDTSMNGDVTFSELEATIHGIRRERQAILASLNCLDSVLTTIDRAAVIAITFLSAVTFIGLVSWSSGQLIGAAGGFIVLYTWLTGGITFQRLLASILFVLVNHVFDVGDRISVVPGHRLDGRRSSDDFYVISLGLTTTVLQSLDGTQFRVPNYALIDMYIANHRLSRALTETVPFGVKWTTSPTTLNQLRKRLQEFVDCSPREYMSPIVMALGVPDVNHGQLSGTVILTYRPGNANELLRIYRRNNFVMHMLAVLRELGIEGARSIQPGGSTDTPLYLQYSSFPGTSKDAPMYTAVSHQDDEMQGRFGFNVGRGKGLKIRGRSGLGRWRTLSKRTQDRRRERNRGVSDRSGSVSEDYITIDEEYGSAGEEPSDSPRRARRRQGEQR